MIANRTIRAPRRGGFTMTELVVVMGIIVFLSGALLVAIGPLRSRMQFDRTDALLTQLTAAAQEFKQAHRSFPDEWHGKSTAEILEWLRQATSAGSHMQEFPTNAAGEYTDAWGNPVRAQYDRDRQTLTFTSAGPSGMFTGPDSADNIVKTVR